MNPKDDSTKGITHGVPPQFPKLLYKMLNAAEPRGYAQICSWQPHGMSFAIHDRKELVHQVLPLYFNHHKFASFQRQLNLYGFSRVRRIGGDHKTYYHEFFRRDEPEVLDLMRRVQHDAQPSTWGPRQDPDFDSMYREQQQTKKTEVVTAGVNSRHSAVSQESDDSSAKNSQAPPAHQSLPSLFPQDPRHYELQPTLQQLPNLSADLARLSALITHQSTTNSHYLPSSFNNVPQQTQQSTTNSHYLPSSFNNASQQLVSNTYHPILLQAGVQRGFTQDSSLSALPGDLIAALLHQSIHPGSLGPSQSFSAFDRSQQQQPQAPFDQLSSMALSSTVANFLLTHTEALRRQEQQQMATNAFTMNEQQTLLLQLLNHARLNSSDAQDDDNENNDFGR